VWTLFQKFAFEKIRQGFTHFSVNSVIERIRWETNANPLNEPEKHFKICNNHRPFYARWFMTKFPQYDGFFRLREQTSKRAVPVPHVKGPADHPYIGNDGFNNEGPET
jgi:hypothetical protein